MRAVVRLAVTFAAALTLGAALPVAGAEALGPHGIGPVEQPRSPLAGAGAGAALELSGAVAGAERADAAAGPITLSDSELDAVAAGLAGIDVRAFAVALGPAGYASAETETKALAHDRFEIAYGSGGASALGDSALVEVATSVYGDGGVVIGEHFAITLGLHGYVMGRTGGFVVAVDVDHPRLRFVQRTAERLAAHLQRNSERFQRRAERGEQLVVRNPQLGLRYLSSLQRDYDRLESHFLDGIARLLDFGIGE